MQKANQFRGPDASEILIQQNDNWQIGVGVNRLQVIDNDTHSNQPMVSDCGNYILAFNGEVYNYQDLKNQLINKGYQFKTRSDTEVVLYWLKEFGAEGLTDFKGMFALAFINLVKNEVFISRDKQGIKPLFICQTNDQVLISSSIRAIEVGGLVKLSVRESAVDDYLAYRHVMGTKTFYSEIEALEPGEVKIYNSRLQTESSIINLLEREKPDDLKTSLIDATTLMFEAPTPSGLLLSGGVDSTLLLAILRQELGVRGLNTYTLGIGEDQKWAKRAAQQYDSNHIEVPTTIDDLQKLPEFLENTDQPIADSGAFATWLISEEAAKNSNVLLSGAGADELFGGYNRHRAYYYYLKNHSKTIRAKNILGNTGLNAIMPKSIQQFLDGVDYDPMITYQKFLQNYGIKQKEDFDELWKKPESLVDNLESALEFDLNNYLVGDVLAITDNATMQNSVETRVPYLFDDVIAQAKELPISEKMKSGGKGPLKEILTAYGGEKYAKRKKHGFGLPLGNWFRNKATFWLWEFLQSDSPIFAYISKSDIAQILRQHQQGKKDNSMQLWSILVLQNWLSRTD